MYVVWIGKSLKNVYKARAGKGNHSAIVAAYTKQNVHNWKLGAPFSSPYYPQGCFTNMYNMYTYNTTTSTTHGRQSILFVLYRRQRCSTIKTGFSSSASEAGSIFFAGQAQPVGQIGINHCVLDDPPAGPSWWWFSTLARHLQSFAYLYSIMRYQFGKVTMAVALAILVNPSCQPPALAPIP